MGWGAQIAPFSFSGNNNDAGKGYSASSSTLANWYTGSTPKYAPGVTSTQLGTGAQGNNWMLNCSGCHITGVRRAFMTTQGEYVVNPFTQRCGLHNRVVQATDYCDDFETRPPRKEPVAGDSSPPPASESAS